MSIKTNDMMVLLGALAGGIGDGQDLRLGCAQCEGGNGCAAEAIALLGGENVLGGL